MHFDDCRVAILSLSFLTSLLYTNTPKRKRSKIEEEEEKTKALHSTIHTNPRINRKKNNANTHRRYPDEWRRATQKIRSKRWICWTADFQKAIWIFIYNRKIKIFAHKHLGAPVGTENYLFCSFIFLCSFDLYSFISFHFFLFSFAI